MSYSEILNHPHFNADDYNYLVAKGWLNSEIVARWNSEAARGCGPCVWGTDGAKQKLAATIKAANKLEERANIIHLMNDFK